MTSDLAQQDLGVAVQGSGASSVCSYASSDGKTMLLVFGEVLPDASAAQQVQPNQLAQGFNTGYGITNAKPLSGVGDKAVEATLNGGSGQSGTIIFIFKANVVMMLILEPTPPDTSGFEKLAKDAANNLH
ncbi:MAG TPA: hypothetical protein VGX22_09370 [Candidatus Dormibacteraeota bacterium]|nr:hypothetical protein [Candidatus Dormibacteraeota bacterium]